MKAIVNPGPGQLVWRELPLPEPGPGQVLIQTLACGICATDLEMIAGWERTPFPGIPGHEWVGRVHAAGPATDQSLLQRICVAENVLADGGEIGFEHPGGYAEYFLTEARHLQVLPDDFPIAAAALIEPLAVTVRGWRRLQLEDKTAALVLGDGAMGLFMTLLLKRGGVERITVVGGRPNRLKLAREFGAAACLNYHEFKDDFAAGVGQAETPAFPNIIEASGSASAANAALTLVSRGGKVLILGDYRGAHADFSWNQALHREVQIIGSCASAQAWPEAVRTAASAAGRLTRLISHEFPAPRFAEAFDLLRNNKDVVKIVLRWDRQG